MYLIYEKNAIKKMIMTTILKNIYKVQHYDFVYLADLSLKKIPLESYDNIYSVLSLPCC